MLRVSRARACGPRRRRGVRMYSGGRTLADFGENWKTQVFTFWENLKNRRQVWAPPPQGANLPLARAAHEKHSGVPRRFRWSMGAVWYRQNDFYGPHARGGGFGHQGGGPCAWCRFLRFLGPRLGSWGGGAGRWSPGSMPWFRKKYTRLKHACCELRAMALEKCFCCCSRGHS